MLKLSSLKARQFAERIGVERMRPLPAAPDDERRVSLGPDRPALRTRDHAAVIYWSRDELFDTIVPYLLEGLRAGDKVVYVADDHRAPEVLDGLRATGADVDGALERGQLLVLESGAAFFPGGRLDVDAAIEGVQGHAAHAQRDGYPRVRFSVEMTYLLADVPGIERGPEFEARANDEVFAKFPFVCVCSFNGNRDVNHVLEDVLRTHPVLVSNGIPLVNPYFRPREEPARPPHADGAPP